MHRLQFIGFLCISKYLTQFEFSEETENKKNYLLLNIFWTVPP